MRKRVVIAGAGVAALEAALALRALADERLEIELLGAEPHFWYRPLSVAEPFQLGRATRYELGALAAAAGATFTLGRLEGIDAPSHVARTSVGDVRYDVLLVAVGALPAVAVEGALTFRGPADSDKIRDLLDDISAGTVGRLAFVVPSGSVWSLPIYELALMTASELEQRHVEGVELLLVTPEDEPLQLFGHDGSRAVRDLLARRGISVHSGVYASEFADGELRLVPEGRLEIDRVVALPRLRGARIDGLPQTIDGFVPIDSHGRVRGVDDVYAAGDITTFPIKQGGIATQLADAAAEAIASQLGADVRPHPFRPVLRGLLLTGDRPRYFRRELTGTGKVDTHSPEPLWWPPAKIVGRHLSPFLAGFAGLEHPPEATPPAGVIEIEVDVAAGGAASVARLPLALLEDRGDTVGELMSTDMLLVAPEDTLGEVAEKLREHDTGSALVVDDGRLIGILTTRDLLRALSARVHPSDARVREWMTAEPVTIPSTAGAQAAVMLMNEHGIHQLPVVEDERPVGTLGYRQALVAISSQGIGLGF